MPSQNTMLIERATPDQEAEVCLHCGNIYKVVWIKEGDNYNDFGMRHCPFCGLLADEYAHIGQTNKTVIKEK